ncbi:MAG: 50S ribosomal protein L11 methyltransferase [Terriglobia bacterium]|jgi:protein arginine N-methyltransferase 1
MLWYGIEDYGKMILDKSRTDAYADALRAVVHPHSIVLDIGTGPGILAFLACRLGARKVYAIEPGDVIQLARQAAAANGFADRIEFIQGMSTRVDLREKVDVIVAEIHGVLPAFEKSLISIMDARDRFLAPGGRLIPQQETLWAALVHAPDAYGDVVEPWENNGYGFDFQVVRDKAANIWRKFRFSCDHLVWEPRCWATLDYRTLSNPNISGRVVWTIDRVTTVHGLAVWFDCEASDGVGFSNSPASPTKHIFGQGFSPGPGPSSFCPETKCQLKFAPTLPAKTTCGDGTPTSPRALTLLEPLSHFDNRHFRAPRSPQKTFASARRRSCRRSTRTGASIM